MKRKPSTARRSANTGKPASAAPRQAGGLQRTEAALYASEARLHLILESAREFAIVTTDLAGRLTTWNAGAQAIFGYEAAEILGSDSLLLFVEEDQVTGLPKRELQKALTPGRASDDRWLRRRDGSRFFASGLTMPLRETSDETVATGFLKILRDDTQRHEADRARHQAEARFRILAESARDYAIFLLDPDGTVNTWSAGAERVKGYSEEEAIGASFELFYPEEDRAISQPQRELAIADHEGRYEKEGWRVRKDQTRYWASETIVRLSGENHELLGFAKICRDLSERKHAEDERNRLLEAERVAREAAEAANRAKDQFLAVLSHELRTPLTPISLAVYGLAREQNLSPSGREAVEMIERNLENETRLIDDLLDLSRSLHGKLDLHLAPLDVHECVRRSLEVVEPDLAANGQRITLALGATNHHVCADGGRLRQVFWNLLKNAVKFTPAGGKLSIRSRNTTAGKIMLEFADNGMGMEAETLAKIFEPFEQGGSSRARKLGGLGLGLAIAHNITAAHDGRLLAHSEGTDRGSTFEVELPTISEPGKKAHTSRRPGRD